MAGSISVAIEHRRHGVSLATITCTLGRRDRPYPEAHPRASWTVALVRRGAFNYRGSTNAHRHALRAGFCIFGRPNTEFECSHDCDGGDECLSLEISDEVLREIASDFGIPNSVLMQSAPALSPDVQMAALIEHARSGDGLDLDETGYLVGSRLVKQVATRPALVPRHRNHARRIHDAIDAIETACHADWSLHGLAHSANLSRFHFLRTFQEVTGATPHQYVIGVRLRRAVKLLLDTSDSVTAIAEGVGFRDLSNFTNAFRRAIGCSPKAFRDCRAVSAFHLKSGD